MSGYQYQPDFVITIGGADVTKHVDSWELHDAEAQISSLTVTIINEDLKFSGRFKNEDKIKIRFGYQGNLSPQVEMTIKRRQERYNTRGATITITGMDCMERMTGNSCRGFFSHAKAKEAVKELCEMVDCKNVQGDMVEPEFQKDHKLQGANERLIDVTRRYLRMMGTRPSGESQKKAIKEQKKVEGNTGSFQGKVKRGFMCPQGPITKETMEDMKNAQKNYLKNIVQKASSISVRAHAELVGVPMLQAKKCVSFANVGPDGNGKWYVIACHHAWSVSMGYVTRVECIKAENRGEQPIVIYAEIYQKDTIYTGPRKINAESQGTFTYGKGDKRLSSFEFDESVQESREGGEGADSVNLMSDAVKESARLEVV